MKDILLYESNLKINSFLRGYAIHNLESIREPVMLKAEISEFAKLNSASRFELKFKKRF